jgi:geranylgeranyl diphosphate synthase type II
MDTQSSRHLAPVYGLRNLEAMASAAPRFPYPTVIDADISALRGRAERAIDRAFQTVAIGPGCPPRLAEAQRYALFPGGGRLRPQLCLLVALACGDARPGAADAAAASIELLHGASLVHDDLPCFDDADMRRGRPSVHRAFGEATALLVGDAFIVHAFDVLARAVAGAPHALADLLPTLAAAAGTTRGILAGQAWESEPSVPLDEYHRAKTASLFGAAAAMGAITAGASPLAWSRFGEALGRAYQAADDLADATGDASALGKPTGKDAALGRPSVVRDLGVAPARERLASWIAAALSEIPRCSGDRLVRAWVEQLAARISVC